MKKLIILMLALFMLSTNAQIEYPKPEITTLMFKLDKLSLDQDHIRSLSKTLAAVAQNNSDKAPQIRANAMFIALALRLNPKNEFAINLNQRFINDLGAPAIKDEHRRKAIDRVERLTKILSRSKEGSESHMLSLYLKDALATLNPTSKVVKKHKVDPMRWQHVLAPTKKN